MPVPPAWIKFHKSCENWGVDGVLDNTVLITIGLEKLKTKWSIISKLSMIVRVNVVLNRTVVVDSDWRFNNLCSSHLQSQSEFSVPRQLMVLNSGYWPDWGRDVIGRLSVRPCCYWLRRLVMSSVRFDTSIVTVKQPFIQYCQSNLSVVQSFSRS